MTATDGGSPLLVAQDLTVRYGLALALDGVEVRVARGEVLAVLGANGAGKSTLARVLSGLIRPAAGTVTFDGREVTGRPAHVIRRAGLVHLPESRGVFPGLSVLENLQMAVSGTRSERQAAVERACELFPVLGQRRRQRARLLSGGEQQMLSLARVLVTRPKLIIADEMSLGLAPRMVDVVFDSLATARAAGTSVIMIEQYAQRALGFADSCLILQRGRQAWSGAAKDAAAEVLARYLGEEAATA